MTQTFDQTKPIINSMAVDNPLYIRLASNVAFDLSFACPWSLT